MTFLNGVSIRPEVCGFYDLRAGLRCFINGRVDFYGVPHYRGILLPPSAGTILWHENGHYAPDRHPHELDIMMLTDPAVSTYPYGMETPK